MTLLLFIVTVLFPPVPDTTDVNTRIEAATVYIRGAEVTRSAEVTVAPGSNHLRFTGLSSSLNEETLQLQTDGNVVMESISKRMNYDQASQDPQLNNLQTRKEEVQQQINEKEASLTVIERKLNVLINNQDISGENVTITATALKAAVDYFSEQFEAIEMKRLELEQQLQILNNELRNIETTIGELNNRQRRSSAEVNLMVRSDSQQQITLQITYYIPNAGWKPSYDVRVSSLDQSLALHYKADIAQNTGVDWNNVQLAVSSAQPRRSSSLPSIDPVYLDFFEPRPMRTTDVIMDAQPQQFQMQNLRTAGEAGISRITGIVLDAQSGKPLIGANIFIPGMDQGTTTDNSGNYSMSIDPGAKMLRATFIGYKPKTIPLTSPRMNITLNPDMQNLDEVVTTGVGTAPNELRQGQTSFRYLMNTPYTIVSGAEYKTVAIEKHELAAKYEYLTIPKISTEAFLTANATQWESLNLLPGSVNLYLGNAYVGKTSLSRNTVQDTLSFSLGSDESIIIEREQIESFREKNFFGNRVTETRGWEITVRNTKPTAINIEVLDQVPVSRNEDIDVEIKELSGATYNESTGRLTWNLELASSEAQTLRFVYEITYPTGKRLQTRQ